jgi:hypothetical protein
VQFLKKSWRQFCLFVLQVQVTVALLQAPSAPSLGDRQELIQPGTSAQDLNTLACPLIQVDAVWKLNSGQQTTDIGVVIVIQNFVTPH